MKVNYLPRLTSPNKALTFIALLLLVSVSSFAQIGVQSPSIRENVTFQWSDTQDIDNNGDISDVENNLPATIESITVNGAVYNTFAVPSGYQLTRLGPGGNAINEIFGNGLSIIKSSATATFDPTDNTLWDDAALATFESKNLNRYYTSNGNGDNICGNFNKANGINGSNETDAQMQTLFYDPALPSNDGGILAVTERGGNNCFYIRLFGTLPGSTVEESLGDTFVRSSAEYRNYGFSAPRNNATDYWSSGREQDNDQDIAIALFNLNTIAPTGSKISRIRFISASNDDGDGKLFVLQRYAQPQTDFGCIDQGTFNGQIDNSSSVPANSTYDLVSGPSPAGLGFNLNPDGSYTYTSSPNYEGSVSFTYRVRLPAPNDGITDTNTVTLTFNTLPDDPELDIVCNEASGKYNINITSPLGSQYEYSSSLVNGGAYQSSPNFSDLGPGTYNFRIKNINSNCESNIISTTITSEDLGAVISKNTSVDCFGESTGSIDLDVSGGYPPYTYSWSNGATTQDLTNVPAGNYNVDITDASGCTFTFARAILLDQPDALTASTAQDSPVACFGESNGSATVTAANGNGGYTYLWDNGETTATATALNAGTHTVTITDSKGCKLENISVTITQPDAITATAAQDSPVTCFGESNGSATVTAANGNGGYTYLWDNGETTATATALNAGTHTVTITDSKGCKLENISVTITQPTALTGTAVQDSPVTCFGESNGSATATAANGNGGYTYLWDNGETTATATALNAGTHTVTITDSKGCKLENISVTITQPTALTGTAVQDSPVTCFGESNGSATATAANGNGGYTYLWDNGETTATATALNAGTHTVTITDSKGCKLENISVTITQPTALTGTAVQDSPVTCFGESNGSATATAANGNGGYTYLWDNGETTATATALNAGTHTVTITDSKGCKLENISVTITQPTAITASAVQDSPVTCFGEPNGSATVTAANGNGGYTYLWDNGETTATATALNAGTHTVTITDSKGCKLENISVTITQPTAITASAVQDSPVTCFGEPNGSATVTAANGNGGYTYLWDNGETTATATALNAGTHTVTITDSKGCKLENVSVTITQPTAITASIATVTDVLCNSEATGSIDITVVGGTAPYSFVWNDTNNSTTEDLSNVIAGAYNVTITDANGCTTSIGDTISEPTSPLSLNITKIDATTAQGCANGEATAIVSGGTQGYTYQWSASAGNVTTATATNLSNGTHSVTITDANNCELTQSIVIECVNTCDAEIAITNVTDVLCTGDASGAATVTANSDANPSATFTFTWSNGQIDSGVTSSTLSAINAGVYSVSVAIDGTVCQAVEETISITEPSNALNITATTTDELGPNTGDGTASSSTTGGVEPYTYSWSPNGETTDAITGLSAGDYTVTVTDANGCTDNTTVTVNPGSCLNLSVTGTSTPAVCFGESNGSITATVTGGSGNFTYAWDTISNTTAAVSDLPAGDYTITVTDTTTLCTTSTTITINEPNVLSSAIAISNILCKDDATGSLDLAVNGGTAPYTFNWDNGDTTEDLINVIAGTYSVTITDANGCITTDSATIIQPDSNVSVTITNQTNIVCEGLGTIIAEATGGISPYSYSIDGGTNYQTNGTFSDLPEANYTITAIDANGCATTITTEILINCTDAIADINNTFVGQPVTGNVLTNDEDFEGDNQSVTANTQPANGSVVVNSDGTYTYTPNPDFTGEDTFEYTICDDGNPQACDTATVYIEVLPVSGPENEAPIANADTTTTPEGTPISIPVIANDFDPDGDTISVTETTTPDNGTVTLNPDGTITYTPNPGFIGEDTFTYTICDDANPALCDTATVTVTIQPTDAPNTTNANDDAYTTTPDAVISQNVLVNDNDVEGDNQTVTANTNPNNGTVTVAPNGDFTYTPNPGFAGTDMFTYTICDDNADQACDTATVYITVGGIENTTDAIADINNTFVGQPVTGNVLTNDEDFEGDNQSVTANTQPTNGSVVVNPDGTYTYTPNPDFTGEDTFEYTICDDGNPQACDTATVYIEVLLVSGPENEAPIANADTTTTPEGTPISIPVIANDFDPDGDTISVTETTTPDNGTVTLNPDGTITYTPNPGFIGEDTFTYTICDDANPALCDTATVTVTIQPTDAPNTTNANDDAYTTTPDAVISQNVLVNDNDVEGDNQTVTANTNPNNGTVTVAPNGDFTYTPNPGFAGTDMFTYTICDDNADQACDTATVYITVGGIENTTDAIADINNTFVGQPVTGNVLTNDEDFEGDNQSVTANTQPTNGSVVVNSDGTYTYTPNPDFTGEDTFEYTICDDGNPQACDTATVYIEVLPVSGPENEAPIANADTTTTPEGTPISIPVIANDFDPDGDTISVTETTTPDNGTVTLNPDGTITYTPNDGFIGEDTFTYTICDDANPALCDTATVTVTIQPTDAPNTTNANDDAYTTTPDAVISQNVLVNDNDVEGDNQTVTANTNPTNGTVTVAPNGDFTYTPNPGFAGTDMFTYTICDDNADQACDTATVYITVGGIENTTDAIADINNTFVGQPVTGNVLTNDEDFEGDAQTVTENTQPDNGTVVMNPDGTYTYTPNPDFTGEDTFEYTICDDGNPQACDTATVYIEVLLVSGPENEAPIANADTTTTPEGTPISIPVIANDFDPDGDTISVTETTTPDNGTVTLNPDGTITYTPNDGFIGEDTFTYTICDDANPALCDTATVTVTIQPTDAPNTTNANDDAYTTTPDAVISQNVLVNDNDVEDDNQTVTANTNPNNGTVTVAPNGDFTYTPNPGFAGTDMFTYTICDDNADQACDTATVYITVGGIENTTDAIADINNTFVGQPVTGNVLTNDEDFEGDNQSVTANTQPTNGSVVVNPDGTYTYTPNPDFTGEDTFEYTICDDGNPQACDTATVYIEVLLVSGPENEAPIANADTTTTPEGTPISIPVIANDFDPDGDTISVTETTTPDNGTVTLNPDGTITYTPNPGFIGEDTFTYTICDDANPALCDTATVTVTIQPTDAPNTTNANDDAYTTTPDAVISQNVLVNDNDVEGDNQTVTANTNPNNGTVTVAPNGDFTYTPNPGFAGTDMFTYTICDDNADQACDTATVYITVGGIENTTDAIADINNTFVGQPVTGNVLTNDEDFEGDNQSVTANTQPTNGSVVVNPDGTYTYTPNPDFTGEDTFEYTICDDGNPQACDTATVYIEVLLVSGPENEAPIANADTTTTPEGTPISIPVIANDFDPDGDTISVTETTTPDNGTVTLNPDGTITYTPNPGFIGEDTFTYTICDDANPALCDTATVTVTIQPTDAPNTTNANDDAYTTTPDAVISQNVLVNDNDVEGDNQTVTANTNPNNGTVTVAPNGDFTYTPNPGFAGTDMFTYTICDDNADQACDTATVYITVGGIENTTDAIADINNTFVGQPVTGNVLTNDEDFEGDNQSVTANTQPANGSVVVNSDGTYTYTPNPDFTGEDTFEYTICDDGNPQACDTATVYIEVLLVSGPENEAPIANADTTTTPEGTPISIPVIANDFDPDGDTISVTETTTPDNGTVTLNPDGTITYTPNPGFIGEDTFTYTICDDANPALCDTATVTVTIQPTDAPNTTNANDDAYTTTPDAVISQNVLVNDNDVEGDNQTVTANTNPNNGTVTVAPNGDFTYTPNPGFAGTDMFTYTICDDNADQACDTATVYITVGGIENTTDAIADINNTFVGQPVTGNVLTNDEDFEGDNQSVTANTQPTNGSVVVNSDGTYTYTPNPDFTGEDTFEYTICDDGNPQACDTATVYIEVLPVSGPENEAPIANADTTTTPEGTPISIPVIANDFDPDGDTISVTETTTPDNGTVTLNPDGTITYTPNDGFIGEDTFTYTICDDANPALCDTATVTVTIQPTDAPNTTNANDDAYTTTPDAVISQNVLVNDNDVEGDNQTVTANTNPTNGTVTVAPNGDFTYTPNPGFAGTDMFTYTICDDNADQACDTATVYITVGGIENTTDAIADINNTFVGQPVTGNVLTNDEDFEGDAQTVTENTQPDNGTVVMNPDGTYTYTPNPDFTGEDTFEYTICDDGNPQACDTATVYIEVLLVSGPENEAPIANADTTTTPEGTPISIPVIANDFDPDGDTISVTETTTPDNGTVTLNPDGTITYTPNDGFIGEDTFTYTICDDANPALCDTATVTVTIQPTDAPNTTNANDDAYTTTPDAVISQNVLVNDNDVEGDNQTVTANTNPNNGTVTVAPNGDFTYTPNPGFVGTDMFTYTICDDNAEQACDTATVYITVGGIENTTDAIADINNTFVGQPVTGNVLTNDEDFEGDAQTVTENTQPDNGTVVMNPDGTYTYTPNPDFTGEDTFEYTICDDGNPQACDTATVYIEVLPVSGPENEAPIANADTTTTPEGTPISIPVIANDFDPDGDTISVTETTTPDNGTVTLNPDGTITYTPNDGFIGEDTFTYTICDDANPALCDTATVTVTIQPTDAPNTTNANDDAYTTTPDAVISQNVLVNDNDVEDDNQTVTANTNPNNGTVTVAPNGDFTYTPNPGFAGTDMFTYTICDDNADQACDTATVYITVGGIENTTDAIADINNTFVGQPVTGNVLTNDEDFEGDNQSVTANTQPTNGSVVVNPDGTYTYTPNPDFTGEDTFEYTICDDGNPQACDTATVYIEVLLVSGPENEAPIANADTTTTPEGTPISIPVIANDFDPDGDTISVTETTTPDNGTVTLNPDGTITYTPNPGFIGEDTFTYTICDDANPALCDTATVTVTIQPTDAPNTTNANDDAYTTTPDAVISQNVLVNDNDVEGDNQTVTANTNPNNGTVTVAPNGDFTYTPNPGFAGTDMFTYTICDDNADQACDTATVYITVGGIENTTDAIADINNTFVGQPVTGNVLTNDEDFEGDNQSVTANTQPTNGSVVVNPDGTYTYTPNPDFTGEDTFEYTICDDGNPQACDTATVYIEVLLVSGPENEAPIANADTTTTPEGTPISIPVIANDFDPDGDTISVTETTTPDNGTVTLNPDGTITYTPNPGFIGEDTFTYTICDDANPALCDTATVTVTIQPTDAPNTTNANDDAYTTTPDAVISQNVLVNDNDVEGDNQTVTANTNPNNGTVTVAPNGDFTYTPNPGFAGTDMFTYTICDDNADQACDTATVYITVGGIENTTDAIADINNTFVGQPVTGNVLTNDEDFEGDNQSVTANTQPANGSVVVNSDGTYTYTPNPDFTGEDTFEYTICDDGNPQACDTATVYIEVLPVSGPENEAPIANADTTTTPEGTPISIPVIANDFDPDGDTISVTETTDPNNGTVTLNPDGTITYTPNPGFIGEDTFTYTICDDANPALCDTATVTVTIQPTDAPNTTNANDDAYTTTPDAVISQNVLVNDNDVEGDNQTVTANTNPTNGTVTVAPNGDFTYTPNPGFAGTDMFTYTICDDNADQACDTATVYITVGGIENTTDAIADINNTFVGQPVTGNVLTNDEDFEGDNQSVTANTQPTNGSVVVNSDGTYTYTPNPDFTGEDTFEYTICDDGNPQACDTATVYIEVLPVSGPENEAPIANADTTTTPEGTPISIPVIANDFDPDGDTISVTETTTPDNGTVTLNPDGTITYTPNPGFIGEDTFTYTICDDANPALCDTATVTVTIQPTDSPNTTNANDDAYTTTPDAVISQNVLVNDNDVEGDNQTVTANTNPNNGTVTVAPNGDFTYTPNPGFAGTDMFTYTICDDNADQACDTATVYITVGGIENTTDAIADINNTFVGQPVTGNVLTNDEDFEGDNQSVTANTQPANGSVVVNSDGTYTYTPNPDFTGEDTFEYTICDDGNPQACDTATVYIEVLPVSGPENEAPIANADTTTTPEGTPISIPVIANDFDPDGDTISVTETTTPDNGTVTLNPDGTITYTPNPGFIGEDTFTYTICDDANPALCDTATVTVTIQPTDSPNTTNANDDAYTTTPDAVISQNVLVNDNDVEGDNQTVTANTNPNNGTVTVAPNGDFTYTPNPGFAGTDMFTYTICDDNADQACDTATVYITVGGIENTTDAIADINNTFVGQPVTGNVLTNDEDFEGDNQSVTANTQPANGSVVVNSDGTYTYTPNPDFTGEDTFEYTICDDGNPQACDTATVYIEVLPVSGPENEAPIANADTTTTPEGTPISIPVIANDFDPDGDTISVTETTTPDNGTVTLNPDGTITYTPNPGFIGEDTFTYTICDDANPALCDTATVTVTIQPTDSPNTTNANDDAFFASTCGSLTGNVFVNDNDIEGDTQTITTTTVITTEGVTVIIDANTGEFTYTPISVDFIGNDSFVYSICDNNADQACDQATVYLSITDSTPPSIINCSINDETIECAGDDNESLATAWNDANIAALELCATDACDSTFSGQVTSDYDFDNLVSTCGASGTITVTYTIADANNNTTELVATLTIADTIAPTPTTDIEESLLANCESVPEVPTIEFTDNCSSSVNVIFEETSSFDESNPSDYEIVRTWTVNDDCDNIATYTQTISVTLNDFITTVNERACSDDGTIDLNGYLENDQVGGTWTITQGNANLDESTFNPENVELGNYIFSYTSANNGCLNTTEVVIEIHDECIVLPCGKDDVIISKVVTPNGDAQNEFFTITGVETCGFVVDLKIFNRWGAKIYENSNYQNNWNGTSHKSSVGGADKVPNGTYYYIINLKNSGLAPIAKAFYVGSK